MDEKAMVNDVLAGVKAELSGYEMAITETSNMNLRQTFQQLRDDSESYQYELFKVASSLGYYKPAAQVDEQEIENLRNELENC